MRRTGRGAEGKGQGGGGGQEEGVKERMGGRVQTVSQIFAHSV